MEPPAPPLLPMVYVSFCAMQRHERPEELTLLPVIQQKLPTCVPKIMRPAKGIPCILLVSLAVLNPGHGELELSASVRRL